MSPVLMVFRFSLQKNGKIIHFTFPKEMETETLGLLRSFVKLFSPLLDKDLYENKETVKKVKSSNGTDYEEEEKYDYETTSDSTVLKNKGKVSSSGDTHNTDEEMEQESEFGENGQLKNSKINSTTNFNSEYE